MLSKFLTIAAEKGFTVSQDGLNIVGWRNSLGRVNYFDDRISLYWKDDGVWEGRDYQATTKPGNPFLKNPINPKGTAILVPGQYSYKLGLHHGKYEALVQAGPVKVYRDNNRDLVYDLFRPTIEEGYFGINIHRASIGDKLVGPDSAGCQVIKSKSDYDEFIGLCKRSATNLTYTLVDI